MTSYSFEGSGGSRFGGEALNQVIRHYARPWLEDARREAVIQGRDARRREIVFAVSLAESYLFEWVRDEVLGDKLPT